MFKRIPILMYHSIEAKESNRINEDEKFYNITPERFREQINYLRKNGYNTINVNELWRIEDEQDLPRKPIILTFDDGHISHYEAVLPVLKKAGYTGIFFLISDEIGKKDRLNWEQARKLDTSGMDIGSHGANHDKINKLPYQNLIIELKASKLELEDNIGHEVMAFSIPRGFYSPKISNVARGMGYKFVFTSFIGNSTLYSNPYRMRRTVMLNRYSMEDFIAIVQKAPMFLIKKHLEQIAKTGLQKTIGLKGYERIKKAVFSKV